MQRMGKHEMFRELNCILFYLCYIFLSIVEILSLIRGCKHSKYHDLWNPVLNGPGACVVKRPDSISLTKTKRTFLRRENL